VAEAAIRAFLSYAHADDDDFQLVDPLVRKLRALIKVKTGRDLEVFVDREAIGWGVNWRERLAESVEGATVFIPLLTARYLESQACRDEFLAFHSKADVLGVTDLLLPIVVFRSPLFQPDSSDEVAKIAESLQYKVIEDALIEGTESPAWLAQVRDLAESLIAALSRAESALVVPSAAPLIAGSDEAEIVEDDEAPGLAELMVAMQEAIDELNETATELTPAMTALGEAATSAGDLPSEPTPKQIQLWAIRAANAFKDPALVIEGSGAKMFVAAKRLDEALLGIKSVADLSVDPEIREPLIGGLQSVVGGFGDLSAVGGQLDGLLESMRPAELFSVPLRRSLRPARRGLTSVTDTLQLIDSWRVSIGTGDLSA
jgi:hypothetical protein